MFELPFSRRGRWLDPSASHRPRRSNPDREVYRGL